MIILHKKRNTAVTIFLFFFLTLLLILPLFVFAQETFVPLTKGGIPGIQTGTSFSGFLNATFKLGLAVAATLAVVMITIGGLQYMSTDSISGKTEGRDKIQNAVIGLLIALLIWIILFTINPNLLKLDFKVDTTRSAPTDYESEVYGVPSKSKAGGSLKKIPKQVSPSDSQGTPF